MEKMLPKREMKHEPTLLKLDQKGLSWAWALSAGGAEPLWFCLVA